MSSCLLFWWHEPLCDRFDTIILTCKADDVSVRGCSWLGHELLWQKEPLHTSLDISLEVRPHNLEFCRSTLKIITFWSQLDEWAIVPSQVGVLLVGKYFWYHEYTEVCLQALLLQWTHPFPFPLSVLRYYIHIHNSTVWNEDTIIR